jgi:hypothetical protein
MAALPQIRQQGRLHRLNGNSFPLKMNKKKEAPLSVPLFPTSSENYLDPTFMLPFSSG